jgi:lysophospholipid acyltransferase (LPLAT)-like uncharacterized protein
MNLASFKNFWKKTSRLALAYLIAYIGQPLLRLIMWTCHVEIEGLPRFLEVASQHRCIMTLWHNRLAIVPYTLSTYAAQFIYAAFVSKSRDGELLAVVAKSYRSGRVISVSHQARQEALREMIRRLEENREIILITPDGPRGPRYKIKPGIALAASLSGAHVIPWTWSADSCWQLKTWDALMLPKPFTKIKITFGEPLVIPKGNSQANMDFLQAALDKIHS